MSTVFPAVSSVRNTMVEASEQGLVSPTSTRLKVHCTGEPAFAILKETFGERYLYAGLGTTVLLGPKVTTKAEAGQPTRSAMDAEDLRGYRAAMARGPLRALLGRDGRPVQAQP